MDLKKPIQRLFDDESAVSPVIGVILMVAITVILAAVIASFVLNFGESLDSNVQAGATVTPDAGVTDGDVRSTFNSNQNAGKLVVTVQSIDKDADMDLTWSESDNGGGNDGASDTNVSEGDSVDLTDVGNSVTITESSADLTATAGEQPDTEVDIIVTGVSESGETTTVLIEKTVTI